MINMDEADFNFITNEKNKFMKLFFEKYKNERDDIFNYCHQILENNKNQEEENEIKKIISDINMRKREKINKIKILKLKKYIKNIKSFYNPIFLNKYNLSLAYYEPLLSVKLLYNGSSKDLENGSENIDSKKYTTLLNINFITKINILEEEEWICNADYALYLIYDIKKLNNPHPKRMSNDELSDHSDSSYSIRVDFDIEYLVFISNYKHTNKKDIIELDADLNISDIYNEIQSNIPYYDIKYMKYSYPNIKKHENQEEKFLYDEVFNFFNKINKYKTIKALIFQNQNNCCGVDKIELLNNLYFNCSIRYLYLDLKVLNNIPTTLEKRKYLSYFIGRIYNLHSDFKEDFESFVNKILRNISEKNFFNDFIFQIKEKNDYLINNKNEDVPLYLIIDNIDSDESYNLFETILKLKFGPKTYIYGVINIDSNIGKESFFSLYNKTYVDIGFYTLYLYSNNKEYNKNLLDNINIFFNNIGNKIKVLKDFIQLLYFEKFIEENININYDFLKKYINYIKLYTKLDNNNIIKINNINFKSDEIKNKFISNYNDILISYLNNKNDENLKNLFSDVNSFFFEKQIILDIILNKIKDDNNSNLNFTELKVHSIYCIDIDINKIDIMKYKDKNITLIQESKTAEIYDFAMIIGNSVKLYQVSTKKSKDDLLKLNRNLIEVDCQHIKNNFLDKIGNFENFNFGIITSISTFEQYSNLIEKAKTENKIKDLIEKTSYYLMKDHCKKNKYELLIYDLFEKKFYIEDDLNKLIEYNCFYQFQFKNKLNIPKLENIFSLKPKKISIKFFNKNNFINLLNKTNFFENNITENSLNIIAKFEYKKDLLNIKTIDEDNYYLYILRENKGEKKTYNIIKHKNETFALEIDENGSKNIFCENNNIKINKNNGQVILFNLNKNINFIGLKRKRSLSEKNNI